MLRAAFTSRSITAPHKVHWYFRSARESLAFTSPHVEQVLLVGANLVRQDQARAVPVGLAFELPTDLAEPDIEY